MSEGPEQRVAFWRTAIEHGEQPRVQALALNLDESARVALRKALLPWLREQRKEWLRVANPRYNWNDPAEQHRQQKENQRLGPAYTASLRAARLAVAAFGTQRDVEAALFGRAASGWWLGGWDPDQAVTENAWYRLGQVLLSREEPWRDEVLLRLLRIDGEEFWTEGRATGVFAFGRTLLAVSRLPAADLLPALGRLARQTGLALLNWRDPLDARLAWAALEARDDPPVETQSNVTDLAARLSEALSAGRFERGPLLDLLLRRLAEADKPPRASFWAHLIDALKPTDSEWSARRDTVLDLLSAATPAAATLGQTQARALLAGGQVAAEELLPLLGPATAATAVGVAKGAVALLKQVAKRDSSVRAAALEQALGALTHPKPAVQDAVLSWLEAEPWWRSDEGLRAQVSEVAALAEATVAGRLRALLPAAAVPAAEPTAAPEAADVAGLRERLADELSTEGEPLRRAWLTAALAAVDGDGPVPEARYTFAERWREGPAFEPAATAEEAVRILLRPDRLRPENFERVLAATSLPLDETERGHLQRLVKPALDDGTVARLVDVWLGGVTQLPPKRRDAYRGDADSRIEALAESFRQGHGGLPFGTPTQAAGWLAPEVLAERLDRCRDITGWRQFELACALYRLPPDPPARAELWDHLAKGLRRFAEPVQLALRVALAPSDDGGEAGGVLRRLRSALTAGAGDSPSAQLARLVHLAGKQVAALRLACAAARCRWGADSEPLLPYRRKLYVNRHGGLYHILPPDALLVEQTYWWAVSPRCFEWPGGMAAALAVSLGQDDVNDWRYGRGMGFLEHLAGWHDLRCDFTPVLERLVELCEHGDKVVRAEVVELLVAALSDGRLRTGALTDALAGRMLVREGKPRLLIGTLSRLAEESPAGREVAAAAAETALAGDLSDGTASNALLEGLLAWRTAAGRAIENAAARAALEKRAAGAKGSRATQLAKQALALTPLAGVATAQQVCAAHDVEAMLASGRA